MVLSVTVVYCPDVPTYLVGMSFNSTSSNYSSVVSYSCTSGYVFSIYANQTQSKNNTKLRSVCSATKEWTPPFVSCQREYFT